MFGLEKHTKSALCKQTLLVLLSWNSKKFEWGFFFQSISLYTVLKKINIYYYLLFHIICFSFSKRRENMLEYPDLNQRSSERKTEK